VAVSVVLVNTAPLWVGLLAPLVTRERLSRATGTGIVIAVTGAVMIGCGFRGEGSASNNIAGGILATIGAIGLAGYLLFGRNLRRRHSLWVYVTICYGSAAFYLFLAALCAGQKLTGFSAPVWLYMAVMALVCQILGHTTNNWALRFFSASMISVALLGEPICSTLLAWMIFGETLTLIQVGGSVLVFAGIYVVSRCSAPSQIC
jgi:drug/metabolite transporter (DMT)-like permease